MSKQYYLRSGGARITVSEETYRAYMRPIWREIKRQKTCGDRERSLEQFIEDGYDIPSDGPLVEEIVDDKLLLEMLYKALAELTDDERSLIDALFFKGKSERTVAGARGVLRNTIVYHRDKTLDKLRNILENL